MFLSAHRSEAGSGGGRVKQGGIPPRYHYRNGNNRTELALSFREQEIPALPSHRLAS